jgi:hypothetical protein
VGAPGAGGGRQREVPQGWVGGGSAVRLGPRAGGGRQRSRCLGLEGGGSAVGAAGLWKGAAWPVPWSWTVAAVQADATGLQGGGGTVGAPGLEGGSTRRGAAGAERQLQQLGWVL